MTTVETDATIDATEVASIDAYWRAANYLSVGQIYLLDNPLLREPLRARARQAAAARPLGHDPGPELRLRAPEPRRSARATSTRSTSPGPGHGGPGLVANTYLEGTYSEVYPDIGARRGRACAGCSGSSRSRAASRATSRRRRPARSTRAASSATRSRTRTARRSTTRTCSSCCVVGDGEAETGPLAASWHSNKFLDPARDGAVLPILHLNGYKIANPTVLARIPRRRAARAARGLRLRAATSSRATTRRAMHQRDGGDARRRRSTRSPRSSARRARRRGRGAPALADDRAAHAEGLDRAEGGRRPAGRGHVRARTRCRSPTSARRPEHLAQLEEWMRSYRPEELFDEDGALVRRARARSPPRASGAWARTRTPTAALLLRDLRLPDFRDYAVDVPAPGATTRRGDPRARRRSCATSMRAQRRPRLPRLRPGRDGVEPPRRRLRGRPTARGTAETLPTDDHLAPDGRVMEVLSASTCARAGSRATCSPAATACSTATRRSSTSSTRCSTSTRSG